jgi:hypothetical protein
MADEEQNENERMLAMMERALAGSHLRPRAIHEAGHTVVALRLGLPLEGVDIRNRDEPDGEEFGCTRVRSIGESFSKEEVEVPSTPRC